MRTYMQKVIFIYNIGGVKMEENKRIQDNLSEQIIEQWCNNYPPAEDDEMFTLRLSSYEIAEMLEDFTPISPGDITRMVLKKGYKLVRTCEGNIKWNIKKEA